MAARRLADICEAVVDCPHSTPVWTDSGVVVLRNQNIRGGRLDLSSPSYTDEEHYRDRVRRIAPQQGDLVITREAPMGEVCLIPAGLRCCLGQRMVLLRANRSLADPRYLLYALQSPAVQHEILVNEGTGSTVSNLRIPLLEALPIPLPPLPEQKRIAHILGTLDEKIELNRRMNATLEGISRAIFKSWFVDFDPVRQKAAGKQPVGMDAQTAALFPDSFEDSDVGEVPKGWEVGVLEDVLEEIETGGRPKGGVSGYLSGVPSIGAESIVGLGVFDYAKTKFVPREFYDRMTKGRVQSRDVLLYKDGGRPGQFEPHVTLFGDGFPFSECAINEHVYRLRARDDFSQCLLYFWLSSDLVMEEMRVKGTGVAIPGLNSTQARSLTTLRPHPAVAAAFNERVEPAVARILSACNESRTLAALRDTLLPKLLSGEIRVPEAEQAVEEAIA
jgi:type I restriction enzyme S subunit